MLAKILIVDDDLAIRTLLRDYLAQRHHVVIEAQDGAQAFAVAEKERPHLIIMDIMMPGVYGVSAAKKLAEHRPTAGIPIIIISGAVEEKAFPWIKENPRVRFLRKPIDVELLQATIKELLPYGGYAP